MRRTQDAGAPAVADFNGDGNLDLVEPIVDATTGTGTVRLALGSGAGTFLPTAHTSVPTGARNGLTLTAGDFTGDGHQDVAVADLEAAHLNLLMGDGTGALRPATDAASPITRGSYRLAAADFNRDGHLDVVLGGNAVEVRLGDGTGGFAASGSSTGGLTGAVLAVGDFNADAWPDIAATASTGSAIHLLQGNGSGGFSRGQIARASNQMPASMLADDFNADGRLDIAIFAETPEVYLGDGSGRFTAGPTAAHRYLIGGPAYSLAGGDFDRDGHRDLAIGLSYGGRVVVYLGAGDGSLREAPLGPAARAPGGYSPQLQSGDYNRDGRQDLLVASSPHAGASTLTVLLGTGLPVRPRTVDDALAINVSSRRINYGNRVAVTGAPVCYSLNGREATLWRRLTPTKGGRQRWQPAATAFVSDDKVYASDRPSRTATYQWRFAGDNTLKPAVSELVTVSVSSP